MAWFEKLERNDCMHEWMDEWSQEAKEIKNMLYFVICYLLLVIGSQEHFL